MRPERRHHYQMPLRITGPVRAPRAANDNRPAIPGRAAGAGRRRALVIAAILTALAFAASLLV
ncbi:hypothetical protein ARD30_09005 [Bosea thiooxidans]|uniref:Uncharacterized protein n=1 Tax=Bosea thiooxidans TaxID=53254 RepID=A0A0Q3T2F0_9HYPH|nr:hypothetical protein [Bosea thiooxidans]KQK31866.1 hypothetical protein ARD30_09005 [Bosea thiooxidans]SKC13098.1 hypothetical protein SAMN05660750_04534 [Bosea thiooxidans]